MTTTRAPRLRRSSVVVALALAVAVTGCGGSSEEATEDEAPATTEQRSTTTEEEVDEEAGGESDLLEEKLVDVPGYAYRHLTPTQQDDVVREVEASDELLAAFDGFSAHTAVQEGHLIADLFLLDAEEELASADDAEAQALDAFESWTVEDSTVTTETMGEHQVLHEVGDDGENEWSWWYFYDDGVGYVVNGRSYDPSFAAAEDYVQALVATLEGREVPPPSATTTLPPDLAFPGETPALEQALVEVPGFYYGDPPVEDLADFLDYTDDDIFLTDTGSWVRGARSLHAVVQEDGEPVGALFLYEILPEWQDQPEMIELMMERAGAGYLAEGAELDSGEVGGRDLDLYLFPDDQVILLWHEGGVVYEVMGEDIDTTLAYADALMAEQGAAAGG